MTRKLSAALLAVLALLALGAAPASADGTAKATGTCINC